MLTTRCPHCHTVFRVRPEQLSVRSGRVRCGHCQQAFSALSHLEEMDGDVITPVAPPAEVLVPPPPQAPAPKPAPVPVATAPAKPPEAVIPVASRLLAASVSPAPAPAPVVAKPPAWQARQEPQISLPTMNAASASAAQPVPQFQADPVRPVSEAELESESPVFVSLPDERVPVSPLSRADEPEAPAIGDDFSMKIVHEHINLSAPASASEDMDFDFSGLDDDPVARPSPAPATPVQSELGKALGVRAFDPSRDQVFDQTVMLEEPIELHGLPISSDHPDSLFSERERQHSFAATRDRVEDRRHASAGSWLWGVGVFVLLVIALMQLSFVFRVELARIIPPLRPHLEEACTRLGCSVGYPQDAEQISLEGHSFNPDNAGEGKYHLTMTLLNKAAYQQAWPHLELTVTDRFDIAIARRIFPPVEWLPASDMAQPAFDGHSEITANLPISIRNLQAAGYRLYVFYP